MEVGIKVKNYLEDKGISQSSVSRKTGISQTKLCLSLNGHRRMSFEEYELICGVLGVGTETFLKPRLPQV